MAMHGVLAVSSGMHASRIEETQPPRLCAGRTVLDFKGSHAHSNPMCRSHPAYNSEVLQMKHDWLPQMLS
jgi:hypothetical protein